MILVTGGAGFLGSHLVDALLRQGEEVVIVDDLSMGNIRNVEAAIETGRATFVYADLERSPNLLRSSLAPVIGNRSFSHVYHLFSVSCRDELGTAPLIELAIDHGSRFLYASNADVGPLCTPGEEAVWDAVSQRGLDGCAVRVYNCYGPRMLGADLPLIDDIHAAILSNTELQIPIAEDEKLSLAYVHDVVRLLLLAKDTTALPPRAIDIGNDEELSVLELMEVVAKVAGMPIGVRARLAEQDGALRHKPDLWWARKVGWSPQTSLETGIRKTLDWMQNVSLAYV